MMLASSTDNTGPITKFLSEDHQRLEQLLRAAVAEANLVDHDAYAKFRAGLLRHIGMEEKILLPAVQRLRGGEALPIAAKLRLDHGALAALLMPSPTASIVAMLCATLKHHNGIEEGPGGLYETCDNLAGPDIDPLMAKLRAAPEPAVMPYSDSPTVIGTIQRAMERAGYGFHKEAR